MNVIEPSYEILTPINSYKILGDIERIGRVCYKSEDLITEESSKNFIKMLINRGHFSVLEHHSFSVKFIVDRGVSHEIVRHRLASFSQESTRYCNYTKDKFGGEITVINPVPHFKHPTSETHWRSAMKECEIVYEELIENGESPQIARSVLPNSLKTEIVVTANLREWRTIFSQRTASAAHPQMRQIMVPLLEQIKKFLPVIFDDIQA